LALLEIEANDPGSKGDPLAASPRVDENDATTTD
jgi:hypothetical protein